MITIYSAGSPPYETFQDPAGNPITGTLTLTLSNDSQEAITSPGGQVAAGVVISIPITGGVCPPTQIWSNAELNPSGTYYTADLSDSTGASCWQSVQTWVFAQGTGSFVDLGTMEPSARAASCISAPESP